MKKNVFLYIVLLLFFSCVNDQPKPIEETAISKKEAQSVLPFTIIELNDLSAFKPAANNWQIVGNAIADRNTKNKFTSSDGTGILLNTPNENAKDNLITSFEHGDIELELDIMMPLESNSGIYFQGRYEMQLLDSWGISEPQYGDIGGIYERWNNNAEKGQEGFEGHAPKVNAAKAPGLWQHLKAIFHAPKFDKEGNKIKNAWFEEVRLNDLLLHENLELTGPTRGGNAKEVPLAPILIQGDHGAVAFKNIKYKIYDGKTLEIGMSTLKIYENEEQIHTIKGLDNLKLLEEYQTDSISPLMRIDNRDQKILSYSGTLDIPASGEYLFEGTVNGGAYFLINNDTILNMNGDFDWNTVKRANVNLEKGQVSYNLVYNKPIIWRNGFDFFVEGPKMQRYSLLKTSTTSLRKLNPIKPITLEVTDKPVTQRSFLNHEGIKRSHCISVGLVEKLNYSLDLETGTLLHVWSGAFLDATQMWHSRGEHQRGEPIGFSISSHGDLDFAALDDPDNKWPKALNENNDFKQIGYEFKDNGIPVFSFEIGNAKISQFFEASSNSKRGLDRVITINSNSSIWHKIAEGESIKALPNNTFIINNESYYVIFKENQTLKQILRTNNGKDELLVEFPKGNSTLIYSIVW